MYSCSVLSHSSMLHISGATDPIIKKLWSVFVSVNFSTFGNWSITPKIAATWQRPIAWMH